MTQCPISAYGEVIVTVNKMMTPKKAQIMSYAIDACFFVIHIAMFFLFHSFGVTPMARFNVFSMAFYLVMPVLIHRESFRAFVILVYIEVVLHMTLAVYFVGWECGFQITLVGLNILLFYSEYVGRALGIKYISAVWMCGVGMLMYLGSYIVSVLVPAPYTLPEIVRHGLQIWWGIVVFGIVIVFLQIFVIITSRSEAFLSYEVLHDKLTELPNRYYMTDYFTKVVNTHGRKRYWVAIADLDNFKRVNDTYGHNCGDYVLKTVAQLLNEHSIGAEVCRWGGEEFLISDWTSEDTAHVTQELLDHIRREIEKYPFKYEEQSLRMTMTIGAAWYKDGMTAAEWVNVADMKLYDGKTSGKNKVVM